jgi:hypothetical protein
MASAVLNIGSIHGLAFEISDLTLVQGWADFHNVRMVVRLDHGAPGEDFEEVIALYGETNPSCLLLMWRDAGAVFVQTEAGRPRRYRSIGHVLESLVC